MESAQEHLHLLTGVHGLGMGFEAVAEVPRLVIKSRITPGKEFNPSVPQNEIVVIAFTGKPALGFWWGRASSSRHGSTTPCSITFRTGRVSNAACPCAVSLP
jgi:hypothetical protein